MSTIKSGALLAASMLALSACSTPPKTVLIPPPSILPPASLLIAALPMNHLRSPATLQPITAPQGKTQNNSTH